MRKMLFPVSSLILSFFLPIENASSSESLEKIAIIDAGASGLTAAHTLRHDLGYKDITLFESKTHPRGKVETMK